MTRINAPRSTPLAGTRDCFGTPLDRIQELVSYWQNDYEWRDAEAKLNAFPQFRTEIDGLGLHFLHVRSIARAGSSLDRRISDAL